MKHSLRLTAVALTALAAGYAGCDEGIQAISSADILITPPIQEEAGGIWTTSMIFQRAPMGRTEREQLTIGHSGRDPLVVSELYIENMEDCDRVTAGIQPGEPFPGEADTRCIWSIDERPELPFTLENLASVNIPIAYKNTGVPPSPATVVVKSNALGKETVRITLDVVSATPRIVVSPATIGFPVGGGRDFVNIRNGGSAPLTVSNFRVDLLSDPAIDPDTAQPIQEFVVSANRDLPWLIEPEDALSIEVSYTPADEQTDRARVVFESDDPQEPTSTITLLSTPLFSDLVVSPNPVIFGGGMGVDPVTMDVSLTNNGLAELDILSMDIEQAVDAFRLNGQSSFRIEGGGSRTVTITFTPRSADGSDATLVISSNASNLADAGGRLIVPLLQSNEEVAALEIDPLAVDMSRVAAGGSEEATITLSNPGGIALDVQRIGLTTEADAPLFPSDPEFEIVGGGGMTTIEPGGEHQVTVRFTRGAEDRNLHLGTLVIESDSPTSPDVVRFTSSPVE